MKRILVLPLILCPVLAVAQERPAADINYGWFELGYFNFTDDFGAVDFDGTGFSVDGSIELRDHVHAFVSYRNFQYDATPDENTGLRWGGLGTQWQVANRVSVFGRLGFVNGDGDDGYFASGGVRFVPADGWEIRGGFRSFGWDLADTSTGGFVSGDIWLTDIAALSLMYEKIEDTDTVQLAMRFYFGD